MIARQRMVLEQVNNEDRADWAQAAVSAFADSHGSCEEALIPDLLCNLMHLCDREGLKFEDCLRLARGNYEEEIVEDGPKCELNPSLARSPIMDAVMAGAGARG